MPPNVLPTEYEWVKTRGEGHDEWYEEDGAKLSKHWHGQVWEIRRRDKPQGYETIGRIECVRLGGFGYECTIYNVAIGSTTFESRVGLYETGCRLINMFRKSELKRISEQVERVLEKDEIL